MGRIIIDDENITREVAFSFLAMPERIERAIELIKEVRGIERRQTFDLTGLIASVASGKTLAESIKLLVEGLADVDADPRVQALAAKLKESSEALAAAVQANVGG